MASDMNECLFLTDQEHQLVLTNVESMLVCCLTSAAGAGHFFFFRRDLLWGEPRATDLSKLFFERWCE